MMGQKRISFYVTTDDLSLLARTAERLAAMAAALAVEGVDSQIMFWAEDDDED